MVDEAIQEPGERDIGRVLCQEPDLADERVVRVAARHDATVSQIALAWLFALSPVTLAIPGPGSLAHLEEDMRAGAISLTPDDLADRPFLWRMDAEVGRRPWWRHTTVTETGPHVTDRGFSRSPRLQPMRRG